MFFTIYICIMYIVFLLPAYFSSYTIRLPHSHFVASFANYFLSSLPCLFNFALFKLEFNSNIFQCFSFPTQLSILSTYKSMPFSSNFRFLSCFRVPFSIRNFIYMCVFFLVFALFRNGWFLQNCFLLLIFLTVVCCFVVF